VLSIDRLVPTDPAQQQGFIDISTDVRSRDDSDVQRGKLVGVWGSGLAEAGAEGRQLEARGRRVPLKPTIHPPAHSRWHLLERG